MSFLKILRKFENFDYEKFFDNLKDKDIENIMKKKNLSEFDFLALISNKAQGYIENIARRSNQITINQFGRVIFIFTPMYLSNYCVNECIYCGFNAKNNIKRRILSLDDIEKEAKYLSALGIKHILILTGESRKHTPLKYLIDAVNVIKKYFRSISIEVYPLEEYEYNKLFNIGVDGLTVYQEVYDEKIYDKIHIKGPKKNYKYRLDTPERACKAKIRNVNIGVLLGLNDWRKEAFKLAIHAKYLQNKYIDTEISISLPRFRPHYGDFRTKYELSDKNVVQLITAFRIYMPRLGITISTRENSTFRDNIIGLGVTKMSAGSSTKVGGRIDHDDAVGQFDVCDDRSVDDVKKAIYNRGYQPVFKDWLNL